MASVLAIVSKAVFERDARGADGAQAALGQTLPLDHYLSANKGLAPLAAGGALFMVTVRPPDERLWLVAVLRDPTFQGDRWQAAPNTAPLTDITELLPQIELLNGKGIKPKPGRMGMSLQTPRALNEADVALLQQAAGGGGPAAEAVTAAAPGPYAALLADVIAAPADDAPRLVLADRLMEHGDPRGEFIAAQVQLASRRIFRSQRLELRKRVRALLEQHRSAWTAFGRGGVELETRFKRGFIVEVTASAKQLLLAADPLFTAEPVRRLNLESCDLSELEALLRAPWIGRLEALKLHGDLGDEGAELLGACDGLRGLQLLNLYDCGLGPEGVAGLAGSKALRALRTLTLTGNEIGDEGCLALARSSALQSCEKLYLARTEIGDAGVKELAASPHLKSLRELGLGSNWSITDEGLRALGDSPNLPRLGWVELENTDVGFDTAEALRAQRPRLRLKV